MAPAALSGSGRRAAVVGIHGIRAVSKTPGTEFALIDRSWGTVESFDDTPEQSAYMAGYRALICAKAYKIIDRLEPITLARNPRRFRAKDVADLWRLMDASDGTAVSEVFSRGESDETIATASAEGRKRVLEILQLDG